MLHRVGRALLVALAICGLSRVAEARRETYASCAQTSGGPAAVVGANNVGAAQISGGASILVDYFDGETSTERTAVAAILNGAPYSCAAPSADTTIYAQAWSPVDEAGTELWLVPHMAHGCQESGSDTTQTCRTALAVTSNAGLLQESSFSGHTIASLAAGATNPTLQTDGSPELHINYASASAQRNVVLNSATGAFNFLNTTGIGTVAFWARSNTDGAAQTVMDSNGGTGGNTGANFNKSSTNHPVVTISKAGTNIYTYTMTGTWVVADGWQWIVYVFNGSSSHVEIQPKNVSETFTQPGAVGGTNHFTDLTIGCRNAGTVCGNMDIRAIMISSVPWTSAQITKLKNMKPPRSTTTSNLLRLASKCFTNFVRRCYLFDQVSTLWQDTARTTQVTTDGQSVAAIDDFRDPTNHLNRGLSQATTAKMPIYRDGSGTSLQKAIEFNGTASPNNTNMAMAGTDGTGGDETFVSLWWNRDTTNGSQYAKGADYCSASGVNYVNNPTGPADGGAYTVCHPSTGNSTKGCALLDPTHWNLTELYKAGATYEQRCSRTELFAGLQNISNTQMWRMTTIGDSVNAGFEMDGYQSMHVLWSVNLGTAQMDNIVMPYVRTHFPSVSLAP